MKSSNPALGSKAFEQYQTGIQTAEAMTINGTVNKTLILLVLLAVSAAWVWNRLTGSGIIGEDGVQQASLVYWIYGPMIVGFIVAMVTVFKQNWAPFTAPIYAVVEGVLLGSLSAVLESIYSGIVFQAVALTIGTLFAMLVAYRMGVIKVTNKFRMGVMSAAIGIILVYIISFVVSLFGVDIGFLYSGIIGILFSLFIVVIAALFLVLDFDLIDQGVMHGAPKFMEWYGAFALILTLIWLYISFLRLLSILRQ